MTLAGTRIKSMPRIIKMCVTTVTAGQLSRTPGCDHVRCPNGRHGHRQPPTQLPSAMTLTAWCMLIRSQTSR